LSNPTTDSVGSRALSEFRDTIGAVRREVGHVVVGHEDAIDVVLTALLAGGHVLIEGVPGLGKTLIVRSLADALNLRFSRIQFTVDLMPADVTGTRIITESGGRRDLTFVPGPVFTHVLLADEINRATPKTQSALLEAMAENQVTVAGETHPLAAPFFVLATLNPIEMEGTYRLPEAQLDRFLYKVRLGYPSQAELERILDTTTGAASPTVSPVLGRDEAPTRVESLKRLVREVLVSPQVERYAAGLVRLTQPHAGEGVAEPVARYVSYGASPRGGQALLLGARVRALLDGRPHVTLDDVDALVPAALGHRLVLDFAAEADGVDAGLILDAVVASARPLRT
jgi:MoxR-like ATPase